MTGSVRVSMPNATGSGFRDRRINVTAVKCPSCGADPSVGCTSATGKRVNHPARRRMAIRALGAAGALGTGSLRAIQQMPFADRRGIRVAAGISRQQLADRIGTTYQMIRNWESGHQPAGDAGARYADFLVELRRT